MWLIILLSMALAGLAGFFYVVNRIAHFYGIRRRFGRKGRYVFSFCLLSAVLAGIYAWSGLWNTMIVFIHLLLFWILVELLAAGLGRMRQWPVSREKAGIAALLLTVCYLGVGVYCVRHVFRTAYTLEPEHSTGGFRIVGFSDSHVGTTFHGDRFHEFVETMNQEQPDIVVIVGDFIDDGTSYEDMVTSCQELADLQTRYGVYYVFGNHDCGYSNSRGYGKTELVQNLETVGIQVLEDTAVSITPQLTLLGRLDASMPRQEMAELTEDLSDETCLVVLDHQPNDYAAEAAAGSDLVISGHTHGGQFFPILRAGEWIGANDWTYGLTRQGKTDFIVSSGISNWAFQFKTGCVSEYFVIDLK